MLRNKFGPKSVMKSRIRWVGHVAYMGHRRGAYRLWVGRTDGRRPLGIFRIRWEDSIKTDLKKWDGVWIALIWPKRGTGGGLL